MTQLGDVQLRPAEEAECRAMGFASGGAALEHSVAHSTASYRVVLDGKVLAYWGVRELSVLGGGCAAWMLSVPEIDEHRLFAAWQSMRFVAHLLDIYGDVYVQVDAEYALAVRWLRWLGFRLFEPLNERIVWMRATSRMLVN